MYVSIRKTRAFTLVELLVALAIVAIIVSVSIPMAARMAFSPGRTTELASRELFTLLKAAKIYATTYNVNTAVVYSVNPGLVDSKTGNTDPVIDAVALVRRLKTTELDRIALDNFRVEDEDGSIKLFNTLRDAVDAVLEGLPVGKAFVPISGREGTFKLLPSQTCIREESYVLLADQNCRLTGSFGSDMAMDSISLIRTVDEGDVTSVELIRSNPQVGDGRFFAHVFASNGVITPDTTTQLVLLPVGLLPNVDQDRRFSDAPPSCNEITSIVEIATVVSLYTAIGRIKVSS